MSESELELGALDEAAMQAAAAALGELCAGGDVVLLRGPLGAGKTTFTRALAVGLGVDPRDVRSPTYTVCMRHAGGAGRAGLVHLDLYRMSEDLGGGVTSPAFSALGLEHDELPPPDAVLVVEWSELWLDAPSDTIVIELGRDPVDVTRRHVFARATGSHHRALLDAWRGQLQNRAGADSLTGKS